MKNGTSATIKNVNENGERCPTFSILIFIIISYVNSRSAAIPLSVCGKHLSSMQQAQGGMTVLPISAPQ